MATVNYSFNLPSVGGDDDVWGDLLNANWSQLDSILYTLALELDTLALKSVTLTAGSGLTGGGNLAANRSFAVDGTVVRTSGNQTITGTKTFNGTINGTAVTQSNTDLTPSRLTKVGDFGIGIPLSLAGQDPLSFNDAGFTYSTISSNNPTSTGRYAYLNINDPAQPDRIFRLGARTSGAATIRDAYWRTTSEFDDTDWRKFYDNANILGTVSQSSGVPTGAIIQRGSNSNGAFVRFADGTQICHNSLSAGDVTTASGNMFISASEESWTFPAAFVSGGPPIALSGSALSTTGRVVFFSNLTLTSTGFRLMGPIFSSGPTVQRLTAIGRWF